MREHVIPQPFCPGSVPTLLLGLWSQGAHTGGVATCGLTDVEERLASFGTSVWGLWGGNAGSWAPGVRSRSKEWTWWAGALVHSDCIFEDTVEKGTRV